MSWRDKKDKDEKDIFPYDDIFRRPFFGMDLIKKIMEEMSKKEQNFDEDNPNAQVKKYGPYVWGYSMTMGPDGKPIVKQFGNMDPQENSPQLDDGSREPLVDVFVEDNDVKIIVEMPGVNKEDIHIKATDNKITIQASTADRNYHTEKELDVTIKPQISKLTYNNGILELVFEREKQFDDFEYEVDIV
ncbi:MAG: Hsp20/alpha crystallin family protein [Asgard group archaeon]|nr:Hsp20/alpha crystallin family protein [Asgard group archaeon]